MKTTVKSFAYASPHSCCLLTNPWCFPVWKAIPAACRELWGKASSFITIISVYVLPYLFGINLSYILKQCVYRLTGKRSSVSLLTLCFDFSLHKLYIWEGTLPTKKARLRVGQEQLSLWAKDISVDSNWSMLRVYPARPLIIFVDVIMQVLNLRKCWGKLCIILSAVKGLLTLLKGKRQTLPSQELKIAGRHTFYLIFIWSQFY